MLKKIMRKLANKYAEWHEFKKEINIVKYGSTKKPQLTTSKKYTLFLMINFTIVEIYCLVVMYMFRDISSLGILITSILGETIAYAVYSAKSLKENISKYSSISDDDTKG